MSVADTARRSRESEADVLARKSVRITICGREHVFPEPSRRQNRAMFGAVTRIQQIAITPENRATAVMEMFNFLIDNIPSVAMDENRIDDQMCDEIGQGKYETAIEIATGFKEVAAVVVAPFQRAALPPTAKMDTSNQTSTSG